jgi:hypothetical protein
MATLIKIIPEEFYDLTCSQMLGEKGQDTRVPFLDWLVRVVSRTRPNMPFLGWIELQQLLYSLRKLHCLNPGGYEKIWTETGTELMANLCRPRSEAMDLPLCFIPVSPTFSFWKTEGAE